MLTFNFSKIKLDNPDGVMLDLGCGEGRHIFGTMESFPNMQCVGLDPHLESLDKSLEGLEFFKSISNKKTTFLSGSAYKLPFNNNTFDLVICSEVLEHLHNYKEAIEEINRVLKPGGKFLASVPAEFPEKICWALSKEYQNQPGGHLRIFKKKALLNDISSRGFVYLDSEKFHSIHSAYWWLRCMFWKNQDTNLLVSWYKKLLEIHILEKPAWIDFIDRLFNPVLGKSIAFYFKKK